MINLVCQKFNTITPVSKALKPRQAFGLQTLQRDTVSFSGRPSYSAFLQKFQESNLTENVLLSKCRSRNSLGSGMFGSAYAIPIQGFEDYVIKIPHRYKITGLEKLNFQEDQFPEHNLGQEIGRIGDEIQILKRVKGITLQKLSSDTYTKYYKEMAQIQQGAYDKFAEQVKIANQKGYLFDAGNSGNILTDGKNLNIIDLRKHPDKNALGDLLAPVVLGFNEIKSKKRLKDVETVMTKIFNGAKKANIYTGINDQYGEYFYENATIPIKKIFDKLITNYLKTP